MSEFNMTFSKEEILALLEVFSRIYEIDYPGLKYYNTLLEIEKRILEEVNN